MPKVALKYSLRRIAFMIMMSMAINFVSQSGKASAWRTLGLGFSRWRLPSDCHRRRLSAITPLTQERVRAVMESFPKASSSIDSSQPALGRSPSENLSYPILSKNDVLEMKTFELRSELASRGLETKGDRVILINLLMKAVGEGDDDDAPSEVPAIDPKTVYILRVKGHTTQKSGGLGVGLALYDVETKKELWSGRIYMAGDRTLFEAEYMAVISGMEYAHQTMGIRRLVLQTSSDIIAQQIRGVYKANKDSLRILLDREREVEQKFDFFSIAEISLTENAICKDLASKALATRKSGNVLLGKNGDLSNVDPMQRLDGTPTEDGRWRIPDPPSSLAFIDPSKTYLLRFDGGSRGNPGLAGAGMVIYDESGQEIWSGWKFHHEAATNNLAEYLGLLCGLKCAKSFGITRLVVEGDSQLIVRQLIGRYQCREATLKKFFNACQELARVFEYFEIRHIARAENQRADWLANHAMDLQESGGFDLIQGEI